jgi:hypothetical protein
VRTSQVPESESYRDQLRLLLARADVALFVTLAYNEPKLSPSGARHLLKYFHAASDRGLMGPRWQQKERTFFLAVQEVGKNGNIHHHLLLKPPKGISQARFEAVVPSRFKRIVAPHGSILIKDIYDQGGLAKYCEKASQVELILSTEFHPVATLDARGRARQCSRSR